MRRNKKHKDYENYKNTKAINSKTKKRNSKRSKNTKAKEDKIIEKANNKEPIRVLYKKPRQAPEVKIINNVFKLKKAIVKKNLQIIPYERLYIICNSKEKMKSLKPNIVLTFNTIYGDLILVGIDKKAREFKGLSQEDVIWYLDDLRNKSPNLLKNGDIKK